MPDAPLVRGVPRRCTQPCQKKELLFVRQRPFPKSCRNRECDHVSLLCSDWREAHALRLSNAVLAPQMPVRFHCECAAVLVSESA